MRPEATGFGIIYFCEEQLKEAGTSLKGKTVAISGFGQVAWGAVKKANELGAKVVTISGPDGYIYDEEGIAGEKIDYMLEMRNSNRNRAQDYSDKFPSAKFYAGQKLELKSDSLQFHVQLKMNSTLTMRKTYCKTALCVLNRGANMPCTPELFTNSKKQKLSLDLEKLQMLVALLHQDLK